MENNWIWKSLSLFLVGFKLMISDVLWRNKRTAKKQKPPFSYLCSKLPGFTRGSRHGSLETTVNLLSAPKRRGQRKYDREVGAKRHQRKSKDYYWACWKWRESYLFLCHGFWLQKLFGQKVTTKSNSSFLSYMGHTKHQAALFLWTVCT